MKNTYDLIIIGGGVMGLFTAYYASKFTSNILIIEKHTIGNKYAASSGYTRSIRNDYLDPFYARFAYEARKLWDELSNRSSQRLIVNCGVLNIAKESVTPDLSKTYAQQSYENITKLGLKALRLTKSGLTEKFPQFDADLGCLDIEAGFLCLPTITKTLLDELSKAKVLILENTRSLTIEQDTDRIHVQTDKGGFSSKSLVLTVGIWINEVLNCLTRDRKIQFPITIDKPFWNYYVPPKGKEELFSASKMPVFAYLDVGIYGHPIYKGVTPGVKIGYYKPPDFYTGQQAGIDNVEDFIRECLPDFTSVETIDAPFMEDCSYDLVSDDNFILGPLPDFPQIFVGAGWRGTGYKFAPFIGKTLAQLATQNGTIYDISRFSPSRFRP